MITDILIIGGGGAAGRCAIECGDSKNVIIATKGLFGKSGCTVMAEGGYNAVLNKMDSFEKHFNDTIKGGGYINNPKLVKILVENAPKELKNLERFGSLFDRDEDGNILQRPFGGQSFNRTCYSGDRTGHEIMSGLIEYIYSLDKVKILEDVMAIKLIVKNNRCYGCIFLDTITGDIFPIFAKSTVIATGGAGQLYEITSNPIQKVGDGFALAYEEGVELIDMEMVQFHPTGMLPSGTLVTEAVRGEGGRLYNKNMERFMIKYDSEKLELSTRDVVARAIYTEIKEGRGINNGVYLDVSHLDENVIKEKLETMYRQFLDIGIDITKEPMIVSPTAHHTMGGIRINERCETNIDGLFACGEVCGGIHGANRLGGNALADTQVFGAICGKSAKSYSENNVDFKEIREYAEKLVDEIKNEISNHFIEGSGKNNNKNNKDNKDNNLNNHKNKNNNKKYENAINSENIHQLIDDLKNIMWEYASIVRSEDGLKTGLSKIKQLRERLNNVKLYGLEDIQKYFELKNMIIVSELIITCALHRKESRGAHYREDYPETLDEYLGNFIVSKNEGIKFVRVDNIKEDD